MPKRVLSGKEVIKVLCREFGFYFVSQKGKIKPIKINDCSHLIGK